MAEWTKKLHAASQRFNQDNLRQQIRTMTAEPSNSQGFSMSGPLKEALLVALGFVHPTVATAISSLFACDHVPGYELPFLKADYRLQCNNAEWWSNLVVSLLIGGTFVLMFPLAILVRLRSVRRRFRMAKLDLRLDYASYMSKRRGWDEDQRMVVLANVATQMGHSRKIVKQRAHMLERSPRQLLKEYDEAMSAWRALEFIHGDWRDACWFWEVWEIVRKLCMTALIVVIRQYWEGMDIVCGFLLSVGFLTAQTIMAPYKDLTLNLVKFWINLVESTTLLLLYTVSVGSNNPDIENSVQEFGDALIWINASIIFVIVRINAHHLIRLIRALLAEWRYRFKDVPRPETVVRSQLLTRRFLAILHSAAQLHRLRRRRLLATQVDELKNPDLDEWYREAEMVMAGVDGMSLVTETTLDTARDMDRSNLWLKQGLSDLDASVQLVDLGPLQIETGARGHVPSGTGVRRYAKTKLKRGPRGAITDALPTVTETPRSAKDLEQVIHLRETPRDNSEQHEDDGGLESSPSAAPYARLRLPAAASRGKGKRETRDVLEDALSVLSGPTNQDDDVLRVMSRVASTTSVPLGSGGAVDPELARVLREAVGDGVIVEQALGWTVEQAEELGEVGGEAPSVPVDQGEDWLAEADAVMAMMTGMDDEDLGFSPESAGPRDVELNVDVEGIDVEEVEHHRLHTPEDDIPDLAGTDTRHQLAT